MTSLLAASRHAGQDIVGSQVENTLQSLDLGRRQVPLAQVHRRQPAGHGGIVAHLDPLRDRQLEQVGKGQHQRRFVGRDNVHSPAHRRLNATQSRLPIVQIGWRSIQEQVRLCSLDHLQRRKPGPPPTGIAGHALAPRLEIREPLRLQPSGADSGPRSIGHAHYYQLQAQPLAQRLLFAHQQFQETASHVARAHQQQAYSPHLRINHQASLNLNACCWLPIPGPDYTRSRPTRQGSGRALGRGDRSPPGLAGN